MIIEDDAHKVRRSVESLLRSQSESGAFVASPDFGEYNFCWLRDGSFIAYALDCAGEHAASSRYHAWVNEAVRGIASMLDAAVETHERGEALSPSQMPPARFALDGSVVRDGWPNFQIDGYGTWLWSLGQHLRATHQDSIPSEFVESVQRVARYVAAFALSPCYDVWEENGDAVHTSTLACVYGGLIAAAEMLGVSEFSDRAQEVRAHVLEAASRNGRFTKSVSNGEIEASTLWLGAPFELVEPDDPRLKATVTEIEERLMLSGGVRRYASDTYFGGGAWPVLTASLGWYYSAQGALDQAQACLSWIDEHFDDEGCLAEQYGGEGLDPKMYEQWVGMWGPPAKELVWSHAMHVVLATTLDRVRATPES
ncbi:MAG: glycoside hydrolase family 15 protein [Acidimicrobiales bacterium]